MKFQNKYKALNKVSKKEELKNNTIYERSLEFFNNGKIKDAKRLLEKFIFSVKDIYGDDDKVYVSLSGKVEYELLQKFYKPYKKVYNINIYAVEMYVMYANILMQESEYEKAVSILLEGININPVITKIYYTLAEAYRLQGKLKDFFPTKKTPSIIFSSRKTSVASSSTCYMSEVDKILEDGKTREQRIIKKLELINTKAKKIAKKNEQD